MAAAAAVRTIEKEHLAVHDVDGKEGKRGATEQAVLVEQKSKHATRQRRTITINANEESCSQESGVEQCLELREKHISGLGRRGQIDDWSAKAGSIQRTKGYHGYVVVRGGRESSFLTWTVCLRKL